LCQRQPLEKQPLEKQPLEKVVPKTTVRKGCTKENVFIMGILHVQRCNETDLSL
jgi:hypothetical protein